MGRRKRRGRKEDHWGSPADSLAPVQGGTWRAIKQAIQLFSSGLCRKEGKEGRGEKKGGEGRGKKRKGRAGSFLEGTRVQKATPANHRGSGQAI